jgi:hypothetical protein
LASPVTWIGIGDSRSSIIRYYKKRTKIDPPQRMGLKSDPLGTSRKGASSTRFKQQTQETGFKETGINFNHADGEIVLLVDSSKPARSHSLRGSASTDVSH